MKKQRGFIINPFRFAAASSGLLDSYTTNLWGAYGLVLLRGNYAGSCIKVRRSSDSTTQDIGFVGTAVDTAAIATFVGANDGFIDTWYDQSGGGNHLTQATAGAQAKIVEAGTYMGEVCFDGVDDQYLTANNSGTPTAFTCYMGGRDRIGAAAADGVLLSHGSGTAQLYQTRATSQVDNYYGRILCGTTGVNYFDDALAAYPAAYAAVFDRSGSPGITGQGMLWINGTQQSSITTTGIGTSGSYTAGAWRLGSDSANFSRLGLASFLIYETGHSGATIGSISALIKPAAKVDTLGSYTTSLWGLYSLRRLRSGYAGSCIRVRRSSDNVEADIGFDGTTHLLDTVALAAHVGANSGYVVTWYDQSGGGNNFTQATAANQPRIVNAGTVDRGLTFDGTNDALASGNSGTPSGLTVHFLGNVESNALQIVLELSSNENTQTGAAFYKDNTAPDMVMAHTHTTNANVVLDHYPLAPAGQVMSMRWDRSGGTTASQLQMYSGGRAVTATSEALGGTRPSGNYDAKPWYLGARGGTTLPAAMDVETLVIYETAQTDALIETIARAIG